MSSITQIEDFADDFNPITAMLELGGDGHITDPFPEFARLRRIAPVHELDLHRHFGVHPDTTAEGLRHFMVLGFSEAIDLLMDPSLFSNRLYARNVGITFGTSITVMDPPEHTKYRRLFQAAFTPRMLTQLRPMFQSVIDRLIDRFAARGSADLVGEFALHFPFQFIMDLMDMDLGQRPTFHKLAMAQTCVTFDALHATQASRFLWNYLSQLVRQRRTLGSDSDFVSVLANAEVDGERLPDEILVSFLRQLMNAGGDTSYHSFSNTLAALLTHPDQLALIAADRTLIPQAVEEGLRWGAPVGSVQRSPQRDLEFAGLRMNAGDLVHVVITACNRDANRWEQPDAFDIMRLPQRHLAFAQGPHICMGQHLARMELGMALNTLLDRLPGLRLDPDKPRPVIHGVMMRGADAVHVRFD
jgi:cytochrome P450